MKKIVLMLLVLVTVLVAVNAMSMYYSMEQYELYDITSQNFVPSKKKVDTNSDYSKILSLIQSILYVFVFLGFTLWFHGVHEDLEGLEVKNLHYQHSHAFWSFFIPIINLLRPHNIAQEIWKASSNNSENWQKNQKSKLIMFWWLCLLSSLFIGYVSGFLIAFSDEVAVFKNSIQLLMLSDGLMILAVILMGKMILQTERKQREMYNIIQSRNNN